ncbi:hypothetical protein POV27_01195 [Aureisphaera galaxeae]|uniref:hypothetical protein n=1 Tax=Aureisphaera galaxeae TaxID=1538023 RepID=UPI00234FBDE3|nr:hypothetical protein [Aureisphaera galaxeae]MDC8002653.1 hypothetical protein [Aureisphaera galaxeae]
MKISNFTYILLACTLLLSCSNDGDENCEVGAIHSPNAQAPIDGAEYQASLMECRMPRVQNFRASNIAGAEIEAAQGTRIFVNPQTFEQNGIFIDGDVDIALIEMYEPGEIIACQLSTNGINLSGNVEPLFSESIFYIDITYQGEPVSFLQPIRVFVPSDNLGEHQFLFYSPTCPELNCTVLWEEEITSVPVFEKPIVDATGVKIFGYQTILQTLGWKNIGRYNEDTAPRTIAYNKAPTGYNKTNGNVFLCYNTASTAIGLFDEYDSNLDVYSETYAQIPEGVTTDAIFVTLQNSQYVYATKRGTVTSDFLTATLNTQLTDEAGLINAINGL